MKARVLAVIVCVMAVVNFASADTIRGIGMDFVTIGNAGNAADNTGMGSVGYNYRIGKYETTNSQWNTFTAAAGAPTGNDGGYSSSASFTGAQQPTNCVSWYETLQFCNYLTTGDKSKGAYQFSGDNTNPGNFLGINRTAAQTAYGTIYVIPTEDEWYKAAYFKPNGSGYSLYANGTNVAPSTSDSCYSIYSSPWDVGTGTMEQNSTFDMMGNLFEWNETLLSFYIPGYGDITGRGNRGGSYSQPSDYLAPYGFGIGMPSVETDWIGLRVASIPEPTTLLLLGFGALSLIRRKKLA
jgi:formylglycine-generating enzyme required for sulfatase activity